MCTAAKLALCNALVAQGIEHRSPKAGVGRSNRLGGTENLDTSGETDRDSEWQKHSESRSTLLSTLFASSVTLSQLKTIVILSLWGLRV